MLLSDLTDHKDNRDFSNFFPKLSLHTLYCFVSYSLLGLISDDGCSTVLGFSLLVSRTGFGGRYRLWWAVQAEGTRESVKRKSHNST